jgi:hypothetical protein
LELAAGCWRVGRGVYVRAQAYGRVWECACASAQPKMSAGNKKPPNFFEKMGMALGLVKRKVSVLVLGLDNSGKSTLLTHLKPKKTDITEVAPTVGFSVEAFAMGGRSISQSRWSVGGPLRIVGASPEGVFRTWCSVVCVA